jgi:hypothetical protein
MFGEGINQPTRAHKNRIEQSSGCCPDHLNLMGTAKLILYLPLEGQELGIYLSEFRDSFLCFS